MQLVKNWKDGWRWFSNVAFTAIAVVNSAPLPPELIDAMPDNIRVHVTVALAVVGVVGRFIDQSKAAGQAQ